MIARLTGRIIESGLDEIIVDVNGVGYLVHIPVGTAARLKADDNGVISLVIHTNVRDDAIQLFGFEDQQQKHVFNKLTSISGVGPRLALSVLSDLSISDLIRAVHSENMARLTSISGIGKKTAQRLLLELRNAFDDMPAAVRAATTETVQGSHVDDLRSALINLGHKPNTVDEVVDKMAPMFEDVHDLEVLLKDALKRLRKE